jgi:hypothetical protein
MSKAPPPRPTGRYKGSRHCVTFPRTIGPAAEKRIAQGEPWLRVWQQQLTMPLVMLAKRSGLSEFRLLKIESGDQAAPDEVSAIALALFTTSAEIERTRLHLPNAMDTG